jgi:very-short-patch-repair endonuclease
MDLNALDRFALAHNGLVTRRALAAAELADRAWYRAIERGLLDPLHPGVARLPGSARSVTQRIHAAVLAAGPGAMASHRSAARLWGIERPDDEPVDVLLPKRTRKATLAGAEIHRPRDLLDLTPSRRAQVPVTNILRTLCDLGAIDQAAVRGAVGHVVTTNLASPAALRAAVRRHGRRGRPGVPALRDALQEWDLDGKPADSVLEPAMRRLLVRAHLPPAQFHAVLGGYEVDFLVTGSPLVLECDGWTTHGLDRVQFQRDRSRDADLAALGFVVLRFTYRDITKHGARTAQRIRRNLERWAPHLLAA